MPYTMARLDQALKLFRKTKRQLVLDGFPVSYLENWIESKYSLRNRTLNRSKSLHSTWIDNDDSGDYNPKDDLQPKRKRVSRPEGAAGPDRETKRQKIRPKQYDGRLLVTLKIRCVEGKASYRASPVTKITNSAMIPITSRLRATNFLPISLLSLPFPPSNATPSETAASLLTPNAPGSASNSLTLKAIIIQPLLLQALKVS
ncbi:hypothetical protein VTN00DRAFT_6645 [Thermoascus crustaceus]|uniref:uncharacterized protein n=1 Tax=Thermoascus crustaceus TaxID=5088 RepID=UPI003743407F